MNINFNILFKYSIPFLILFVLVYFLNTIVFYNLPKHGVEHIDKSANTLTYKAYNIYTETKKIKNEIKHTAVVKKKEYMLLSSLTLNAVYSKNDGGGWAVIKEKSTLQTHILKRGESFKNYRLKILFPKYIIFEKLNKEYKLSIFDNKSTKTIEVITKKTPNSKWKEKVIINGDNVKIKRNFLNSYVTDIAKVWKEIKIDEVKRDGIIYGFKVSRVSKGSVFEKLGLRAGDIITSVNNVELDDYSKAFKIYKDIKNIEYINIQILRNNIQMELNYEIN